MSKFQLEVTEQDMPTTKPLAARLVRQLDTRHNLEYLEAAEVLEIGDGYTDLTGKEADRLYRAIEKVFGPRTAEMKQQPGTVLHSVKRIEQRPERKRKAKGAA